MEYDLFINKMDKKKFRYTNKFWNEKGLNTTWSIGCVSELINRGTFRTKEEWAEFYFHSGEDRMKELKKLNLNEDIKRKIISLLPIREMPLELKRLNYKYGRTKDSLRFKGEILYNTICKSGNKLGLTKEECIYAVFYRVIAETWNGIMGREVNTINALEKLLNKKGYILKFKKTDGMFDYNYEVDYQIFSEDRLICGLQIKPESYKKNSPELQIAKEINKEKNNKYRRDFNKKVFYIYSTHHGYIENIDVINKIIKET